MPTPPALSERINTEGSVSGFELNHLFSLDAASSAVNVIGVVAASLFQVFLCVSLN